MADEAFDKKRLLTLRKLTRALADLLRADARAHIATLGPLLHPQTILGHLVDAGGGRKDAVPGADAAFKELQALYAAVAGAKSFGLPRDLKAPVEILNASLELSPIDYAHPVQGETVSKTVTVTSPLRWVLGYAGYGPQRLQALTAGRPAAREVQEVVVHTLVLHVVAAKQPGVARILEALRLPITTGRLPGLGELPVTFVSAPVATLRPPDEVILESTEISGTDAFEEVVDLESIARIEDPLRRRLEEVVRQHGESLPPA